MPIDTKIEGNPGSVQGAAQWLRTSLGMQVSHAADQINTSRNTANAGWDGTAGQAFSAKMTGGADKAGRLASAASSAAQALDDYAAELQRAHNDMHAVRAAAATGGLTVNGDVIEEPGPAPAMPGPPPTGDAVTPASVGAYNDAATAVNRYAALVGTYNVALRDAESCSGEQSCCSQTSQCRLDRRTVQATFRRFRSHQRRRRGELGQSERVDDVQARQVPRRQCRQVCGTREDGSRRSIRAPHICRCRHGAGNENCVSRCGRQSCPGGERRCPLRPQGRRCDRSCRDCL